MESQVIVRSQLGPSTGGDTIHPPIEGLLPPTGIEPTLFRNSGCKVAGLKVHVTTAGMYIGALFDYRCMPLQPSLSAAGLFK